MQNLVLVVDDEPAIVESLCMVLEAYGYRVAGANSGEEAIAIAADLRPDLLLSDIMMPGLNGFETAVRIKELCPNCHLFFFSGYAQKPGIADEMQKSGYRFELLAKPIHPPVLIEKIQAALAESKKSASAV
jgi:CheY-like chemotaxis protein